MRRGSAAIAPPRNFNERNGKMKLTRNDIKQKRAELVEVLVKAALPFLAGAVGGMVGGCAWGGNGPNIMF